MKARAVRSRRPPGPVDPYVVGLRLLSGRELTSAQLRTRLQRRGFATSEVESAIARLVRIDAVNDARAARALARASVRRGRGPLRVWRELEAKGIDPQTARNAVRETFSTVEESVLLDRVLAKKLTRPIRDRAELGRLHRHLVRLGFSSASALGALRRRGAVVSESESD